MTPNVDPPTIEAVEIREVTRRLRQPFRTGSGVTDSRRILLVRLLAGGLEGWGECGAGHAPTYTGETVDGAWLVLNAFAAPLVAGIRLEGTDQVAGLLAGIRGNPMARAALETAAWDLLARAAGVPLATLLGGTRPTVPAGVAVGMQDTVEGLAEQVGAYRAAGYLRVKIKIGPGWDVEPLEALRERFPDLVLAADANGAYGPADIGHLGSLDPLGLEFLEQPFPPRDLLAHADLVASSSTPICLDESIEDLDDLRLALRLGAVEVVNVKPGRVGGHLEALRIHDASREAGLRAWVGGLLETGIGRAHLVALASLPGFDLPGDLSASERYWETEITDPPWTLEHGHLAVPAGPGIGVTVDTAYLDRITMRSATIR